MSYFTFPAKPLLTNSCNFGSSTLGGSISNELSTTVKS